MDIIQYKIDVNKFQYYVKISLYNLDNVFNVIKVIILIKLINV